MPVEIFLKMDGVTGESRNFQHKGWADVMSWTWAITSNRSTPQQAANENASFNEISLIKRIGRDSTEMMKLFAAREVVPHAELSIMPVVSKKEAKQKYLHLYMEDVVIKSIVTGGSCEEEFFKERVTLLFDRIRFEYNQHAALGVDELSVDHVFGWDISAGKAIEPVQ